MVFENRVHAGQILSQELSDLKLDPQKSIIAAIPRGGVVVGKVISQKLGIPLTVIVIKKLGAYAILRFAIQLMPQAAQTWMPLIATLAVFNILYCGFIALTQRDIKYILAYSSCSHMGYILLGIACLNTIGLNGVVFLMFAHGIMAALAFALTGFIEDQTYTRNLDELGGLAKRMPFIATCFTMAALASAGVPGFANFVAEILVLLGAWDQYRPQTVLAVLGIVITAVYMLKAIRLAFQGPLNPRWNQLTDARTLLQRLPYIVLLAALITAGCWPSLILKKIARKSPNGDNASAVVFSEELSGTQTDLISSDQ
jgi:NADH-quinone oxidoreductase subunit M